MSQPLHSPSPQALIVSPEAAQEYLARMGLDVSTILTALEHGERRAADASGSHYPRTGAGLVRWIETVGTLRRLMMNKNWVPEDEQNRPICVDPDRKFLLGVLGGTDATGDVSSEAGPKAQRRKGRATDEALSGQLTLFVRAELTEAPPGLGVNDQPPPGVWLVVYHRGESGVQVEVSYPNGSEDGQITGWVVRVLLPPFTPSEAVISPDDVGGGDVGFDVTLAS